MKRNYDEASGVTGTTLFVGKEIERTPAYGMKTLFVVGTDTPVAEILVSFHYCSRYLQLLFQV